MRMSDGHTELEVADQHQHYMESLGWSAVEEKAAPKPEPKQQTAKRSK